ncbi:HET-domain-containing protein [Whalleya microplaca]|nr:HET-domain-containing protein [Whalleya microplaca]
MQPDFEAVILNSQQNQIRLLEIAAGPEGEEIRCSYRVVSLDDSPAYHTLSYVWGDSHEGRSIVVAGAKVAVTDNLFSALHAIRSNAAATSSTSPESESEAESELLIWVDALCINQRDPDEKMHQVHHLMRRIYAQCANCFVHFGRVEEALGAARAAVDAMRVVADAETYEELPPTLRGKEAQDAAGRAFQQIPNSAWWSRIWTIQEGVRPRQHTIVWGLFTLPWETFMRFYTRAMALHWPDNLGLSFFAFFPAGHAGNLSGPFYALDLARAWGEEPEGPLVMLWRFRDRRSSDPRDKVYAIMGLLGEGAPNPLPGVTPADYTVPVPTLFKRVTVDLIRDEWSLRPLIGLRGERKSVPDLPSWVVDWTLPPDGRVISRFWDHDRFWYDFTTDRGLPMLDKEVLSSGGDDCVIRLNGVFFDRVLAASKPIETSEMDDVVKMWDALTAEAKARGLRCDEVTDTFRNIAFRGMMEGKFLEHDRGTNWRENMWWMQTLFFTETGYIGLGPSTIQQGDEVWIMSGCRVPFAFRPRGQDHKTIESGNADGYEFVGDTYMPGIMHGEAVESRIGRQRFIKVY